MSSTTRQILTTLAAIVIGFIVLRWAVHLAIGVILGLLPLALVVGGIYVAYQVFGKKALGGGRRILP
ncbi:MAG: hypothetical protein P4L46_15095 [Fimbriimonas sp.]|nr:hypothetical protein [Fimbriimonas sp.]